MKTFNGNYSKKHSKEDTTAKPKSCTVHLFYMTLIAPMWKGTLQDEEMGGKE